MRVLRIEMDEVTKKMEERKCESNTVGGRNTVDKIKKFKLVPLAPRFSDLLQENKVYRGDSPCPEWNVLIYV